MAARAHWFGDAERPALGWLSQPSTGTPIGSVVIAPPVGYAYWCSHRALRVLALRLAARGYAVLRFDYDGTGDSAGDQWDPDRVAAWRRTLALAVQEMRPHGDVTLVGAGLGATLALLDAADLGVDTVVAWSPVVSGRRYVRALRLLSTPVPESDGGTAPPGTVAAAGNVFSAQTLADLQALALSDVRRAPARTLLVTDPGASGVAHAADHLRSLEGEVEHREIPGAQEALDTPPELADLPEGVLDAVDGWLATPATGRDDPGAPPEPPAQAPGPAMTAGAVHLRWRGELVSERAVVLGDGHVGILTEPVEECPEPTTLVLLNPGSETHVGPGRAWVEYARDLALRGRRTVRVDFRGWGESPDAGHGPGRPYDAWSVQDTASIVQGLRDAGLDRIVVCGLCASAWVALAAAVTTPVEGVIAINPQLYWKPGDPVEIDWDLIRARRAGEIQRIERGARIGLWDLLDRLGHRPRAARWLEDLAAGEAPIHLLFAEGDDGLVYLDGRLRRRVARLRGSGAISVTELPGVDHPMHRTWMRPRVVEALDALLGQIDAAPASAPVRG